jgi:hypothetical protein
MIMQISFGKWTRGSIPLRLLDKLGLLRKILRDWKTNRLAVGEASKLIIECLGDCVKSGDIGPTERGGFRWIHRRERVRHIAQIISVLVMVFALCPDGRIRKCISDQAKDMALTITGAHVGAQKQLFVKLEQALEFPSATGSFDAFLEVAHTPVAPKNEEFFVIAPAVSDEAVLSQICHKHPFASANEQRRLVLSEASKGKMQLWVYCTLLFALEARKRPVVDLVAPGDVQSEDSLHNLVEKFFGKNFFREEILDAATVTTHRVDENLNDADTVTVASETDVFETRCLVDVGVLGELCIPDGLLDPPPLVEDEEVREELARMIRGNDEVLSRSSSSFSSSSDPEWSPEEERITPFEGDDDDDIADAIVELGERATSREVTDALVKLTGKRSPSSREDADEDAGGKRPCAR